jgi:acyl-CoA thioesterase
MTQDPFEAFHKAARRNPFWQFLGIEVEDVSEGRVRLRVRVRDEICGGPGGRVHGGVYPALVDAAVGGALMTMPDDSARVNQATVDLNVSFLRPVASGYLHVEGRVLRRGATVGFGEASVTDDEGRLAAVGRATYLIIR